MTFLIIYDRYCARFRSGSNIFLRFSLVCLAHCIMALVTEITVNLEGTPQIVNDVCHILFFVFSLLYSLFYLEYALSLILPKGKLRTRIMIYGYVLSIIALVLMLVSPIEYISGQVTKYSAGVGPTVCYALGFIFFITADILIIVYRKKIKTIIIAVLMPLSTITFSLLILQILIPEYLYTAQSLTLLAVGVFFAIENPVGKFKDKAFIDYNIQTWNRNCYEFDLEHSIKDEIKNGSEYVCVMADINGLKRVNDTLGHLEGDRLIEGIAKSMQKHMENAYRIYRVGGDEFLALYFNKEISVIEAELEKVDAECKAINLGENMPVGVSIGYAKGETENVSDAFRKAEKLMYESKRKYYETCGFDRRQV